MRRRAPGPPAAWTSSPSAAYGPSALERSLPWHQASRVANQLSRLGIDADERRRDLAVAGAALVSQARGTWRAIALVLAWPAGARGQSLQACQELHEPLVDLGRALLLDPVPGPRQHRLLPEIRHRFLHGIEVLPVHREHRVNLSRDKERRLAQLRTVQKGRQFPHPIDIAVPVQPTPETGALEFAREEVDVLLRQPGRQRLRQCAAVEKSLGPAEQETPAHLGRGIPRRRVEEHAYGPADIGLELRLSLARCLEVELIKLVLARHALHRLCGADIRPGAAYVGDAEQDDSLEDVRPQQGAVPGDGSPPVVADDGRPLLPQGMHEPHDISRQLEDVIGLDGLGPVGMAIATLVRCHHAVPRRRQRRQLVPPGVPTLREAMAQDDQRALALLGDMHPDPVCCDEAVVHLCHPSVSSSAVPALDSLAGSSLAHPALPGPTAGFAGYLVHMRPRY